MASADGKRAARSKVLVRHYDIFSMGLCRCHGHFFHIAANRGKDRQAARAGVPVPLLQAIALERVMPE